MNGDLIHWSPGVTLEDVERQVILKAYTFYKGNKTATATALGIAIRTLDNKLEKYELDDKTEKKRLEQRQRDRDHWLKRSRGQDSAEPQHAAEPHGATAPGAEAQTGIHGKPAVDTSAESAMPLPQREEIQGVSSKQAAAGGARGRR